MRSKVESEIKPDGAISKDKEARTFRSTELLSQWKVIILPGPLQLRRGVFLLSPRTDLPHRRWYRRVYRKKKEPSESRELLFLKLVWRQRLPHLGKSV